MIKHIPLLPLPLEKAKRITKYLLGFGEFFSKLFPSIDSDLERAGFDLEAREWFSIAVFSFLFYFLLLFGIISLVSFLAKIILIKALLIALPVGIAVGGMVFLYLTFYPRLQVNKKVKGLEANLIPALHHLLIQIRSGVPLFNCLVSVAYSNYGILSKEMKKAVNEINTGKAEVEALEMLARENPSVYFRRVMWQIVNALKSGADIGSTVKDIVDNLSVEQTVAIKKYGSQLNPIALMYMIFCVIFPTLGITFLLILTSFVGLSFNLEWILLGILAFLAIFQFMLIGLIKSRRPIGI